MEDMDCIDVLDRLSEFYDDQLSIEECTIVKKHLEKCKYCAEVFEDLVRNAKTCADLPEVEPPTDFMKNLHVELVKIKAKTKKQSAMRWIPMCASVAAAVLIFAGWGMLQNTPSVEVPVEPGKMIVAVDPKETVIVPEMPKVEDDITIWDNTETTPEEPITVPEDKTPSVDTVEPGEVVVPPVVATEEPPQVVDEEIFALIRSGARSGYISQADAMTFLDAYEDKITDLEGEIVICLTAEEWQAYLDTTAEGGAQVSEDRIAGGYRVIVSE